MDNYQPIFDAVRSKISNGDIGSAIERALAFENISHYFQCALTGFSDAANEMMRPSVLFKPKLGREGKLWGVLYGDDPMVGIMGFGETPEAAMRDFDKNWINEKIK